MAACARSRGYALLTAVVTVALVTLATLVPLQNARFDAQRERELELLFVGRQYADALDRYRAATPVGAPAAPATLDELLLDRRFPQPRRHLRRLYVDPITGTNDWVVLREQGRIVGLHSASRAVPLKRNRFPVAFETFAGAGSYAQWRFVAGMPRGARVADTEPPAPAPDDTPVQEPVPEPDARQRAVLQCRQQTLAIAQVECPSAGAAGYAQCMARYQQLFRQCLQQAGVVP